jgi:hypothetical protein
MILKKRSQSFITGTIVDKDGGIVPRTANLFRFKTSCVRLVAGVDSGDPVSCELLRGRVIQH